MTGSAKSVLALDLGTGGCKASVWHSTGVRGETSVVSYETLHPGDGLNEQRPADWWAAVLRSSKLLRDADPAAFERIEGVVLSGQSLGCLPLDQNDEPLEETTPIWSDSRGHDDAQRFFEHFPEDRWYLETGNGFSPGLYPVFTLMHMARTRPEISARTRTVIGSKDYINLRLTGVVATDHSYASGSGCYSLAAGGYDAAICDAAGIDISLFPAPVEASEVVGTVLPTAAAELGVAPGTPVFSGGVDNSCMALGSGLAQAGRSYASLGSSSWVTVASAQPVLDVDSRPFVFRHVVPGLHVSALSTFSSGTSFDWVKGILGHAGLDTPAVLDGAMNSPAGARGALFLPTLAGGTPLEGGSQVRGGFVGLGLSTTQEDVVRAVMEGIALALRRSRRRLGELTPLDDRMIITGGGSRHAGWNQIYAEAMGVRLVRTTVGQDAATLGAAAAAFVGLGAWPDHRQAEAVVSAQDEIVPDPAATATYDRLAEDFEAASRLAARYAHHKHNGGHDADRSDR
ncbi:xylulokinase [Ornithinimicrobium pratense]|uniref:Pentose kinase n=1 Tax=Ornithinimicrobium pratense TaxID=2593973 RepID=A0A5J6V9B1_9MICO|nr:FGGY family carbohydrate kinase [Ornithinimicrobium pratense]QFG69741.1 pentose kinase [Ornithinimicrobium pratense]